MGFSFGLFGCISVVYIYIYIFYNRFQINLFGDFIFICLAKLLPLFSKYGDIVNNNSNSTTTTNNKMWSKEKTTRPLYHDL